MGEKFITLWRQEKSYKVLVGMPEEKTPIRRHRPKSHHNLKDEGGAMYAGLNWQKKAKNGGSF
jgi:hypothetical protein